jgi:cell division protein ZipA
VVGVFAPQAEEALEVPSMRPVEPLEPLCVSTDAAVDVPATARGASGEFITQSPAIDLAADSQPEPPDAAVAAAPPVDAEPAAATSTQKTRAAIQWPPRETTRVLALRIVKTDGGALAGRAVRIALESAGLASGPQSIYHRADGDGAVIVSAANLVRPGTLDPQHMDAAEYRGLSMFSVLPGPLPASRMLGELVATARSIAQRLGAIVQDENGGDLDGQRLVELRRSLPADNGAP